MKRKIVFLGTILGLVFLALNMRVGYAEPNAAPHTVVYEISWYTVDGSGAPELTGGMYTLSGTIGQYDAGWQGGGSYSVNGGFWGLLDTLSKLFLPSIMR